MSSVIGSIGGLIGGAIGKADAAGDAGDARNQQVVANQIIQDLQNAPDISKPLILEQYRQQGILTPQMEQQVNLGISQASQVKANPQLQAAQMQALQQMGERAQGGLTASDRAAFNQMRSQAQADQQAKQAQIMQTAQAQSGGAGTMGATLAAKLSAAQAGANTEAMNSDQLAAMANQNALQAASLYGGMAGQMNQQQFGQQSQAAGAADAFRQFDVQNQVAQQQRNVGNTNQAQQYNLNTAQQIANMNTSQQNQELNNQLQRQMQQWQANNNLAGQKSASLRGESDYMQNQAQQKAQAGAQLGAGIGGIIGTAAGGMAGAGMMGEDAQGIQTAMNANASAQQKKWKGGSIEEDYRNGGQVPGHAPVEGDSPKNDIVDAKLSPGEVVLPRSILDQLKGAHDKEFNKHVGKIIGPFIQKSKGYADGGTVTNDDSALVSLGKKLREAFNPAPNNSNPFAPHVETLDEKYDKIRQQNHERMMGDRPSGNYAHGGEVEQPSQTFSNMMKYLKPKRGYADGGEVDPSQNLSPEQFEQHLKDLEAQGLKVNRVEGDTQNITAQLPSQRPEPASLSEIDEQSPDDKALEQSMANEDFVAGEKADKAKKDEKPLSKEEKRKLADDEVDEEAPSEDAEAKSEAEVKADESKEDSTPQLDEISPDVQQASAPNQMTDFQKQLKDAQAYRQAMAAGDVGAKYGSLLAAGIAGHGAQPVSPSYFDSSKLGQMPVQNIAEKLELQKYDPNSEISTITRQYLDKKGFKTMPNMSASDILTVAPFLAKDDALKAAWQKAILAASIKQSEGEKGRQAADKRTKEQIAGRIKAAEVSSGGKIAKEGRDAEVKLENDMTSSRGKMAIQLAQRQLMAARNALKMFKSFGDPDKWNPQQTRLFNSELARIAQQGAPTETAIRELSNPTAIQKMAGITQFFTNRPVGAHQKAFILQSKKYLEDLQDLSKSTLADNTGNTLRSYRSKLSDEAYRNAVARHTDMLGLLSPDQEAGVQNIMKAKGISREKAIVMAMDAGKLPKEILDY